MSEHFVLPVEDALRLGMYSARAEAMRAQRALFQQREREAMQAAAAIAQKHGLSGLDLGIVTTDDGPHPLGTVYDPKTGKPLPARNEP